MESAHERIQGSRPDAMTEHPAAHVNHHGPDWLKLLAIGTTLAAGAVILSPYVLPALGIGDANLAAQAMTIHGSGLGEGLAGAINRAVNAFPGIGPVLAQGGFATAAATGITGIGGVLLGRYIDHRSDGTRRLRWGKLVTTAALLTSALIALPTALTGLSVGLTYLAAALSGNVAASAVATTLANSIGVVGAMNFFPGLTGIAAIVPHLLTCGVSLLPAALSISLAGSNDDTVTPAAQAASPIAAEVEIDRPTAMNKPCAVKIKLKHADTGLPLTADELAVVHTEKLHLFIIDSSLKDYRHIHPQPTGEPGVFSFHFTPETANRYSLWVEATPLEENKTYQLKTDLPSAAKYRVPAAIRANSGSKHQDMYFNWHGEPLRQGRPGIVEISIADDRGRAVTDLEPVMGAMAHLVGFPADGASLIHTHPLAGGDASQLRFHIEPERAGAVQFYLQIRRGGEDIYVPFGRHVQPPVLAAEKLSLPPHAAMGHSL